MTDFEKAIRAYVYCHSGAGTCKGCEIEPSEEECSIFINEQFSKYLENIEKEPAPVAADTDSEVRNSPNISTSDNTTETSRCQGLSGISGLRCLESALDEWLGLGQEAEIVSIEGDREKAYLRFLHDGQIYEMGFRRCRDV